jgi:hypothetical protein
MKAIHRAIARQIRLLSKLFGGYFPLKHTLNTNIFGEAVRSNAGSFPHF